jgi:hypothetical protein
VAAVVAAFVQGGIMVGPNGLMRRDRRGPAAILVVSGLVVVLAVFAAAVPARASTLYADDFEDGNANGWTLTGGSWSVLAEDGGQVLNQSDARADARAVANLTGRGTSFGTIVTARVKPHTAMGGDGMVALLFDATDTSTYFYVALRAATLEVGRRQAGTFTALGTTPYSAAVGSWQTLTLDLTFPNQVHVIALGSGPGLSFTVGFQAPFGTGNKVGFATVNAGASFDNVRIDDDVFPPPTTPPPSEVDVTPPTIPGTPVASAITSTGATLTWAASTDNVGVTGYQVTTVVPPGSAAPIRVWTTPTNSLTIVDLPPSSTTTLQVRAFDAARNFSQPSGLVTVTTPGGQAGCRVGYRIVSQWAGGFQADVTVANTSSSPVNGWTLRWSFPDGPTVAQLWNAILVGGNGPAVTVTDAGWNAVVPAGGSVGFGFLGTGAPVSPAAFTLNAGACALG